ncbi:MAG TPA: glycosyltransferase [Gammaproteobacteria bacterium]|nr:glycosyltransferase [Gammaproteobacteria bacterium]
MDKDKHRKSNVSVAVIIPAYNAEAHLEQAVKSARAQSLTPEEIVVVNDGSSDRTAEIAEDLGVKVLSRSNAGVSAARNSGIGMTDCEWIAFLDADDVWEPDKLERQFSAINAHPQAGLVTTDFCQFNDEGEIVHASFLSQDGRYASIVKKKLGDKLSLIQESSQGFSNGGYFLVPSAVVVRRALVRKAGLFDESLRYAEDLEFFLRVLKYTPILVVEEPLVRYRVHGNNASNDRLKMALGVLATTDRIFSSPERYESDATVYAQSLERRNIPIAGRELLEIGEFAEARRVLSRRFGVGMGLRSFSLWLSAVLGPMPFHFALSLKRKLSGKRK